MDKLEFYRKLANVQKNVDRIPKTGRNQHQNYNYVEEAVLLEHVRPLLLENDLVYTSTVLEVTKDGKFAHVKMEFSLVDLETGYEHKSVYWGEGMDGGDKAYYKAYTGATKYFFMKTLLLSSGDDVEASTPERDLNKHNNQQQKPYKSKQQPKQETPLQTIKKRWKEASGDMSGFEEWYQSRRQSGMNDQETLNELEFMLEKRKQAKSS